MSKYFVPWLDIALSTFLCRPSTVMLDWSQLLHPMIIAQVRSTGNISEVAVAHCPQYSLVKEEYSRTAMN